MGIQFKAIPLEQAQQTLAHKERTSKHRETLMEFYNLTDENDEPVAAVQLEGEGTDKKASLAAGLLNALAAARKKNVEWGDKIMVRNRQEGLFLIRKDLLGIDDEPEAEAEVEPDAEPVTA